MSHPPPFVPYVRDLTVEKCELCTRQARPNDILCKPCAIRFDAERPNAELSIDSERNMNAVTFFVEKYGKIFRK